MLMLFGNYTIYKGKECKVVDSNKKNNTIKVKVDDTKKIYKIINRDKVKDIYSIKTDCFYKGYRFQVIAEKKEELLIYTSNYEVGKELDMEFIEKLVYHKWVSKNEVEIKEIKTILDL